MATKACSTLTFVLPMFVILMSFSVANESIAQTPQSATVAEAVLQQPANMDAERAKIWNSPNMVRARLWLYDRISKSAKITPAEGEKYIKVLQNMTADEMKLWLMKFDEEEEQRQAQYAFWQQGQQNLARRGTAANRAATQAEANINSAETAAATEEQGQLNEEATVRQEGQFGNQYAPVAPYGGYGGYGYGLYPNYGGIHYHYHYYR